MRNMRSVWCGLICVCFFWAPGLLGDIGINQKAFIDNFIKHYEFSPEGRYVHEYHPYILNKTAQSFDQLEDELRTKGFNLSGRCVILGYEENAVPPYYTNYKEAKINDEASIKSNAGWSQKLHNRFGFMTGFLFKDIARVTQSPVFEHVNAGSVFLFDDRASIFQEHAFDEALGLILKAQGAVLQQVKQGDVQAIFQWLIRFWQALYSGGFKVGNKQVAGTQDILFSIENARHVISSNLPVKKFAIGPDITYPIEIFSKQEREATRNAQTFVKSFVKNLEPVHAEPTVYIFCSFVDGVGKSTMLGNIKNWMVHGDQVQLYDHVDNSSSQTADIFQFKEHVFIADMPAQVSHFTYKPDGLVYVDAQTEYPEAYMNTLRMHVRDEHMFYEHAYEKRLSDIRARIAQAGFLAPDLVDPAHPADMFMRNIILLKKEHENRWVPFEYEHKQYLFDKTNLRAIRVLTTLAQAKSEGLKNIESEQMLFCLGIRFPLVYRLFLDDLITKLTDRGVKNVVFVDFLGMYPRSSRENVRINYLLQQFALLDPVFNPDKSIYKNFVSGGQLLHYLLDDQRVTSIREALELETMVRFALYELIIGRQQGDLTGISIEMLTQLLRKKLQAIPADLAAYIRTSVGKKVIQERERFKDLYGLSKHFVNIQQFDFYPVCKFCALLQEIFVSGVECDQLQRMWDDPGVIAALQSPGLSAGASFAQTTGGVMVRKCFTLAPECRDETYLAPFLRMVRASWYSALSNLIFSSEKDARRVTMVRQLYPAPALFVAKPCNMHEIQAFQIMFEPYKENRVPSLMYQQGNLFHLVGRPNCGIWEDLLYRLNWDARQTHSGVYAYGCDLGDKKTSKNTESDDLNVISRYVKKYQGEHDVATVMTAGDLYEKLSKSSYWKSEQRKILKKGVKHGQITLEDDGFFCFLKRGKDGKPDRSSSRRKLRIFLGRPEQKMGIRRWIRLVATLEMVAKDPEGNIAVRFGNRRDFKAAVLLLEKMTLPLYFGVTYKEPLFDDYDTVEPYPSWGFWEDDV